VDLVRHHADFERGLRGAHLGRGDREQRVATAVHHSGGRQRRGDRCGDLAGGAGELLLDRLELADLAAELRALRGVAAGELERVLERAGGGERAGERAAFEQPLAGDAGAGGATIAPGTVTPSSLTSSRGSRARLRPGVMAQRARSTQQTTAPSGPSASTAM